MQQRDHKLYYLTPQYFRAYSHRGATGNLITQAANAVPMMVWPNGRWCLEANIYLQTIYSQGVSRRDRGGTLFTYATQISQLIRFCYENGIDFHKLDDKLFSEFISNLIAGNRNSNTVISYGRRCLDFLSKVGEFHCLKNFLGRDGLIRATKETTTIRLPNRRRSIQRTYWNHRSFPVGDAPARRLPITDENIQKFRDAVLHASSTLFVRKRRYAMLGLLEITGARRFELSQLKVSDVLNAASMQRPFLKLLTAKKRGNLDIYREIPISRLDLKVFLEYIEFNRSSVIRRTVGRNNDHGFFLISETTGKALSANTISQELHSLRSAAKIEEQACAHMFRHAFISKLFIALKEQHKIENPDEFRILLLDMEGLLAELLEWTGHSSIDSLMIYIHQAFDTKRRVRNTVNKVLTISVINKLDESLADIESTIDKLTPKQSVKLMKEILKSARLDLSDES